MLGLGSFLIVLYRRAEEREGGEWKNHCFWNVRERRFRPVSKVPSIALPAAGFPTGADRKADRRK